MNTELTPEGAENLLRNESIGKLAEHSQTFTLEDNGADVHQFFRDHPSTEGVIILNQGRPVGLIMRNDFYQKLGSQYGRSLFMHRSVSLIMNPHPLIVDGATDIATISMIAMNRQQDNLYDMVVVTEDERFVGVVSIKNFLMELSRKREKEIDLLKQQKEILRQANEAEARHRQLMEEKNVELGRRNAAVRNLLDNAGQGFLSFGADMVISEEYSLECVELFRGPIGGKSIVDLLTRHLNRDAALTVTQVFSNVFIVDKALQQKVYLSLLPREIRVYDKIVSLECKILQAQAEKSVMLILTDITEKKLLESKMIEERNNLTMVVKALSKQSEINAGIEEFKRFILEEAPVLVDAAAPTVALAEIFRIVHTHKGDFAQLGLHNSARSLHEFEDRLAAMSVDGHQVRQDELVKVLGDIDPDAVLQADTDILVQTLGRNFFECDERFLIGRDKIVELENRVRELMSGPQRDEMLRMLTLLRCREYKQLLKPYDDYLSVLAERLEKMVEPMVMQGDDIHVDKDGYFKFNKSLVHLFRNMIDHGIETVEDRIEIGKPELGRITCRTVRIDDATFELSVSDDGHGVDIEAVRRKAVSKGILTPERASALTRSEVLNILFLDSFSTRDSVSMLSGRGVGLAAVKAEVERLGGFCAIETELGRGTTFRFRLPIITNAHKPGLSGNPACSTMQSFGAA